MNSLAIGIAYLSMVLTVPVLAHEPAIALEDFNHWIFGNFDNPSEPLPALEAQCNLELIRISQTASLPEDQRAPLRLAGQGDIKRFLQRVEKARRRYVEINEQSAASDALDDDHDEAVEEAYLLAMSLRRELRKGLFGSKSLLHKVASNSLDEQHAGDLQKETTRRVRLQTESAMRVFVTRLGWQLPLTKEQRTKLTDLLLQHIKTVGNDNNLAYYVVMYRFGKVPREQYETIFDESQMEAVARMLDQGRQLEEHLEAEGVLDE